MIWTLAPALVQLRSELDARWPNRDHSSDGAIGDFAHAHTASDHNPTPDLHVVCAYDIDTDLDGTDDSNDPEMDALVEHLRAHPHPNQAMLIYKASDPRFGIATREPKYGYPAWTWRPYTKDPHISHPHISVGEGPEGQRRSGTYNDTTPWLEHLDTPDTGDDDLTPEQAKKLDDLHAVLLTNPDALDVLVRDTFDRVTGMHQGTETSKGYQGWTDKRGRGDLRTLDKALEPIKDRLAAIEAQLKT